MATDLIPFSFSLSTDEDKHAILRLMQRNYPDYGYTETFFNWQYNENPAGKARIFNIKDDDKIIGIYCMIPNFFYWRARQFTLWRIQNVMVDETYRGQKLFQRLMHFAQSNTIFTAKDIFFAFPNENSYRSFQNEDFTSLMHPPFWYHRKNDRDIKVSTHYIFKQIYEIPEDVDILMKSVCKNIKEGIIVKNKHFLTWRYMQRPFGEYKFFGLYNNSLLLAFAVVKYYNDGNEKKMHICEILPLENDIDLKKAVLNQITYIKDQENASILNIFQTINDENEYLEEMGFEKDFLHSRWIVFKDNKFINQSFGQPRFIDFSLGDNDIF